MENPTSTITATAEAVKVECSNGDYEATLRKWWQLNYRVEAVDVLRGGYRVHFRKMQFREQTLI